MCSPLSLSGLTYSMKLSYKLACSWEGIPNSAFIPTVVVILADVLGLELSGVVGVLEYPLQNVPFGPADADLDPYAGRDAYSNAAFLPFDYEPAVEVSVGLQVSYDIRYI